MKKSPRKSLLNKQVKINEPLNNNITNKDHSQNNLEPEGFLKKVKPETENRKNKRKQEPEVIVTQLVWEENFTKKDLKLSNTVEPDIMTFNGQKVCETVQAKKRRKKFLTPKTDDQLSNAYGCPSCNATFASIFDLKNHITAVHESKTYNVQIDIPTVHEVKAPPNDVLNEIEVHEGKKYLKCHFNNCDYTAVQTWKSCKTIMLQHIRAVHGGEREDNTCHYINCDYTSKGQLISELLFGVFKFPTNQRKNLINFCPRI